MKKLSLLLFLALLWAAATPVLAGSTLNANPEKRVIPTTGVFYDVVCMSDVYDVTDTNDGYLIEPSAPSQCGMLAFCREEDDLMFVSLFNDLLLIEIDRDNMSALLNENYSEDSNVSTSGLQTVTTEIHYYLYSEDCLNGFHEESSPVQGHINPDGSISFDSFVVETERIVTITNSWSHQLISSETTTSRNLYRNMVLAKPNGVHRFNKPAEPDPGTVQPMSNGFDNLPRIVPVYIVQRDDTVMVWNLYNMGGFNRMVIDNGFFDWPWQQCGYNEDGGCWYNYTAYRSYTPQGEPMLSVVTYLHRLQGVKGKVTQDGMTWGNTTFGNGKGVWSADIFCDNTLTFKDKSFDFTPTVWNISDVTRVIDGILTSAPEIILLPSSDPNDDGDVDISDVTWLIDRLLLGNPDNGQ